MPPQLRTAIYDLLVTFFDEITWETLCSRVKRRDLAKAMVTMEGRKPEHKWDHVLKWDDKPNKNHPAKTRKDVALQKALVEDKQQKKRKASKTTLPTEESPTKKQKGKAPAHVQDEPIASSATAPPIQIQQQIDDSGEPSTTDPLVQNELQSDKNTEVLKNMSLMAQTLVEEEESRSRVTNEPAQGEGPIVEEFLEGLDLEMD